MFETYPVLLAVYNTPNIYMQLEKYFSEYKIVGIITNSVDELKSSEGFERFYSSAPDFVLYHYSELYGINGKVIVLDLEWSDDARVQFGKLLEACNLYLGVDFIYETMQNGKIDTNLIYSIVNEHAAECQARVRAIAAGRKFCVVHGNCQSHVISSMLCSNRSFREKYITCIMPYIWEGEEEHVKMEKMIKSGVFELADYLISQDISPENRFWYKFSLEYFKTIVPSKCKIITISNLFFMGYFPQYKKMKHNPGVNFFKGKLMDATEYYDVNVIRMILDDKSDEEIIQAVSSPEFYKKDTIIENIYNELDAFWQKEKELDIQMTDYLKEHFGKYLIFATSNHPTSGVLMELTRRIMKVLGINEMDIHCPDDEVQEPMPKTWRYLIYPCVLQHLGIERELEYKFGGYFYKCELGIIPEGIEGVQVQEIGNDFYRVIVKGSFDTYMRIYIRCLRASLMLI